MDPRPIVRMPEGVDQVDKVEKQIKAREALKKVNVNEKDRANNEKALKRLEDKRKGGRKK